MEDLKFVDQHNMVAYLEKSEENVEFHQIVNFLFTCSINYALTVSPTIYASYIEQFWNTVTFKTVNSVKQIHAIVDDKVVVIYESSVRSDLLFNDEDGITCLTNDEIFENLALIGYEQLSTKLTFQKAPESEGSTTPPEPQPTAFTSQLNVSEPQIELLQTETPPPVFHEPQSKAHIEQILQYPTTYQRKRKTQKRKRTNKDIKLPQTSIPQDLRAYEAVHKEGVAVPGAKTPWEVLLLRLGLKECLKSLMNHLSEGHTSGSGEGSMEYHFELTDNVPPTPYDSPLSGEEAKTAHDWVINRLKLRVKRLEKKRKARTPQPMKRRFDFDVLVAKKITTTGSSHVSTADQVSTSRPEVSAATPSTPPTTTTVFDDEDVTMAMAQTLIKMNEV
ncbi:hypothetical protein Tco_0994714 [Tanacetum coccineum]